MKRTVRFPEYFDPSGMTLKQISARVKGGDKPKGSVVFMPVQEIAKAKDYEWSRTSLRRGIVPVGEPNKWGCPADYSDPIEGPERWDALASWMKKHGWKCDQAHVDVGRDGKVKLAEGNHRVAVAESIGLDLVPVQFHDVGKVSRTAPKAHAPRSFAEVPRGTSMLDLKEQAAYAARMAEDYEERKKHRLASVWRTTATRLRQEMLKQAGSTALGRLSKKGRIPAAQVQRAMKSLGRKVQKCGITASALREGMEVEREHSDVTGLGLKKTAKVAAAHLCERPDYYKRLKRFVEG